MARRAVGSASLKAAMYRAAMVSDAVVVIVSAVVVVVVAVSVS